MTFKQKTFTAGALYEQLADAVKWLAVRAASAEEDAGALLVAMRETVRLGRNLLGAEAAEGLARCAVQDLRGVEGVREAMTHNLARARATGGK